jgi:hypothetical protein
MAEERSREARMAKAIAQLENAKGDKIATAGARANFMSAAMDVAGGPNNAPDGRVTSKEDLKAMDADNNGKLTREEILKGIGAEKLNKKEQALAKRLVKGIMDGKDERPIEEVAAALQEMRVEVDGPKGGQGNTAPAPKSRGSRGGGR